MRFALLVLIGACGFSPNQATSSGDDGGGRIDAPIGPGSEGGSNVVPPDGPSCYGRGLMTICFTSALPATYSPTSGQSLDTSDATNCTTTYTPAGGRELCVIAAHDIDLTVQIRASGTRPLVLVAANQLEVHALTGMASIDVASRIGSNTGAGGNDSACVAPSTPEGDCGGGGGGAGGSFASKGGDGGTGDGNNNCGQDGTASPGVATAAVTPTFVRGGCQGGIAGGNTPNAKGSAGGNGGGAIYLIAGAHLIVGGTIDAGGSGGPASGTSEGGAGAGAGGMIGFDSPIIDFTGQAFANGGGGGEGGTIVQNGAGGNAGQNSQFSTTTPAQGGTGGTTDGAKGGNGSLGATLAAAGSVFNGGGGGGGGGAGYFYTFGTIGANTGIHSP